MSYDQVKKSGYWWGGLYKFLYEFVTDYNAALVKLDADTGDTLWRNEFAITSVSIGPTYGKDLSPLAMPQGKVIALLKEIRTDFNALMDAIADDDGVDGTTIFTALKFGTTTHVLDTYGARAKELGEFSDEIALFCDDLQDKFNDFLDALDADGTLTDEDYFSTYSVSDVVEASSSSSSSRSLSSSSSSSSCRSSSSSSSRSSSSSSCRSSSSSSSSSSSCLSSSSSSSCLSSSSSCRSSSSSSYSSSSSSSSCRSSSSSSSSSSCLSSSSSSCRSSSSSSSSSSSCLSSSSSSSSSSCRSSSSSSSASA